MPQFVTTLFISSLTVLLVYGLYGRLYVNTHDTRDTRLGLESLRDSSKIVISHFKINGTTNEARKWLILSRMLYKERYLYLRDYSEQ